MGSPCELLPDRILVTHILDRKSSKLEKYRHPRGEKAPPLKMPKNKLNKSTTEMADKITNNDC